MKALLTLQLLPLVTSLSGLAVLPPPHENEWGYGVHNGPDTWPEAFNTCDGYRQSPIDLRSRAGSVNTYWEPFEFCNYDLLFLTPMTLIHDGNTVKVPLPYYASVQGGNLTGEYEFVEFHFHWGASPSHGSEHTIDGHRYAGEIHIVHYNTRYPSFEEAKKHEDGLAVLGIMIDLAPYPNPKLQNIVDSLAKMSYLGKTLSYPIRLTDILPQRLNTFFRYKGSLTTPPCNEVVTWTVFKDPIYVSENQMKQFIRKRARHGVSMHNFRPVQPLNNREVYFAETMTAGRP